MNAINNTQAKTVENVVKDYRNQVGLDKVNANEDDGDNPECKKSKASFRPLSKRHAMQLNQTPSVVLVIKEDPQLEKDVDSLCRHSGGTKSTHSIIQFLREKLGEDRVSYTDDELKKYIEDNKSKYKIDVDDSDFDVGLVGVVDLSEYDDDVADYAKIKE
jgi:hypothetical protein